MKSKEKYISDVFYELMYNSLKILENFFNDIISITVFQRPMDVNTRI